MSKDKYKDKDSDKSDEISIDLGKKVDPNFIEALAKVFAKTEITILPPEK